MDGLVDLVIGERGRDGIGYCGSRDGARYDCGGVDELSTVREQGPVRVVPDRGASPTAEAAAVIMASVTAGCAHGRHGEADSGENVDVVALGGGMLASPTLIGGNGDPVATSARPSVQSARSCGRASLRLVGLDSGMMTGRLACAATRRTTCSVKAPHAADSPMSAVGCTASITSVRLAGRRVRVAGHGARRLGETALRRAEVRAVGGEQAVDVDKNYFNGP